MQDVWGSSWPNLKTSERRLQDEWPLAFQNVLTSVTYAIAAQQLEPLVIQIGPSYLPGNPSRFQETESILEKVHPSTKIVAIDSSEEIFLSMNDRFASPDSRVRPIYGDGWHFSEALQQNGLNTSDVNGKVSLIVASNNLGIIAKPNLMSKKLAMRRIHTFLDQALEALHPDGQILLVAMNTGLQLSLTKNWLTGKMNYTIPTNGYVETRFYFLSGLGVIKEGKSKIWNRWIKALRQRHAKIPLYLKPEIKVFPGII